MAPLNPEFKTGPLTKAERRIVQGWKPGGYERAQAKAVLVWAPKAMERIATNYPDDPITQLRHYRIITEQIEWANEMLGIEQAAEWDGHQDAHIEQEPTA